MPRMYNPVIEVPCPLHADESLSHAVSARLQADPVTTDLGSRIERILTSCTSAADAKGIYKLYNPASRQGRWPRSVQQMGEAILRHDLRE